MKRKRNIQGKFVLKNQDYRQVRSLRLTDTTWKAWGIAAECLGLTRADLLENLVQQNNGIFPLGDRFDPVSNSGSSETLLTPEKLTSISAIVLKEMRVGKQSHNYKVAQKALKKLIKLACLSTK